MGMNVGFVVLTVVFVMAGCTGRGRPLHSPQSTLHSPRSIEDTVGFLYGTEPDRALQILDSAERLDLIPHFRADILRTIVYSHSNRYSRQDSAIQLCEQLLLHDSLTAKTPSARQYRRAVLDQLCTVFRFKRNLDLWLYWARNSPTSTARWAWKWKSCARRPT